MASSRREWELGQYYNNDYFVKPFLNTLCLHLSFTLYYKLHGSFTLGNHTGRGQMLPSIEKTNWKGRHAWHPVGVDAV